MHKTMQSSCTPRAPKSSKPRTNLELWPKHFASLPFTSNHLARRDRPHVVIMAATRSPGIPISWVSRQLIDGKIRSAFFIQLKAFTKGMFVVCPSKKTPAGVARRNAHDLNVRVACAQRSAAGRAYHRRFFYSSHRQSHASLHEMVSGSKGNNCVA